MKRSEVREFIRQGVIAIQPTLAFDSGLLTDFNSQRTNIYPKVFLESLNVDTSYNAQAPLDVWPIQIYIAFQDRMDSLPVDYEDLVDQADFIAQKLMYLYRKTLNSQNAELVKIENTKRTKWIKQNADCLTGILLTFQIRGQDTTNVCP